MTGNTGEAAFRRLENALRLIAAETQTRPLTNSSHEDADEIIGSFATDSAHGFDPLPVLQSLHRDGAQVVVMGQFAGIMHGSAELTGDLDLLWDGEEHQAARLAAGFAAVGAAVTADDGMPLAVTPEAFRLPKVLFSAPSASGDRCTPSLPWGNLDIRAIIQRAETAVGPGGVVVRYVSAGDLIVMRRAAGRPKDHRRADELERLRNVP